MAAMMTRLIYTAAEIVLCLMQCFMFWFDLYHLGAWYRSWSI